MPDARTLLIIGFCVWWLFFSVLTVGVVRDSQRRQGRRLNRQDLVAILAGPLFWLECLIEATREAREATALAQPDPVKPDYQPGDEVVLVTIAPNGKAH